MKRQSKGGIIVRAASLTALDADAGVRRTNVAVASNDGRAVSAHLERVAIAR